MMWWQLKFAKNAAFGLLPFPGKLRTLKRKLVPYQTTISSWTLEEGLRLIEMIGDSGYELRGKTVLEIGTGWQPTIPLLFHLAGCTRVILVDSQRLMDAGTLQGTVRNLAGHAALIADRLGKTEEEIRKALSADDRETWDASLSKFGFEYLAPLDLTSASLPEASVDVVASRAVLEHVPPNILREMLSKACRLLRPGGLTSHAIDNSDHWSHTDRRLSRVNFLRYDDRTFRLLCFFNPLDYQNRLRHFEYLALLREAGFEIVRERSESEIPALDALKTLPLAARFQEYDHSELAKMDSYILARKPAC